MSEPITRRKILVDYRIRTAKCQNCGKSFFPPKTFCDLEGRNSTMTHVDLFYRKGSLVTGTAIRKSTKKFEYLPQFLSGIISFEEEGLKVPGRITDYVPPQEELNISDFIGKDVVPRFRKTYTDGESGLIYYSSLNFSFEDDYYQYQEYEKTRPSTRKEKPGIVGYGVYLPKFRIRNETEVLGVKERTLPFPDEDTTTFSVEAGKRALIHSGIDNKYIKKCFVGSESTPYAVKPSMSTVSQVLELGEKYEDGFFSGGIDSQFACKAASDLFIDAAALVVYPTFQGDYVMVIGADNSQAAPKDPLDYAVGAGGVAYLFGNRDVIATLDCYVPYTSDTPDFYRRDGEKYPRHGGRFTGRPAYFKHVVTGMRAAMKTADLTADDITYVVAHSPNAHYPNWAAQEAGFDKHQIEPGLVIKNIGNLYSGLSLAALAAVLDIAEPDDRILMTSYGSGAGSDSYIFTVTDKIEEKRRKLVTIKDQIEHVKKQYVDYPTYRNWKGMN